MTNSVVFKFQGSSKTTKGENDEELTVYSAIASTDALDRDKEVLLPKGAIIENFMKNPVMLGIHNYHQIPVGKVLSLDVTDTEITFDFVFAPTDTGKEIEGMYKTGFMSAFSVGLYPLKALWLDEDSPTKMEVEVANGKKQSVDLSKYKETPRRLVHQWELLEISPVPVPANPEALLQRATQNIIRKYYDGGNHSKAAGQIFEHQLNAKMAPVAASIESFLKELVDASLKDVVTASETTVHELPWDASDAQARLAAWSSEDSSGDKETIDWGKFAEGYALVDLENADKFSAYSYLHHTVRDGELVAVWKGICTAMSKLLKSKSELDEELAKAVYDHLAQHYKDFDKEAPELEKEYTDEELEAIADGKDLVATTDDDPASTDDKDTSTDTDDKGGDPTSTDELVQQLKGILSIKDNITELEETLRLRLNIFSIKLEEMVDSQKALEDLIKGLKASGQEADTSDSDDKDTDTDDSMSKEFGELSGMLLDFHNSRNTG